MGEYSPGVTLITCTGDRPEAFDLCARFVARQTYQGPLQWIVVNDAANPDRLPTSCPAMTWLLPLPAWRPGQNTLARNLLAAIPEVRHDKVLFIEDDDWYAADYVETMADAMETRGAQMIGTSRSLYYHVPSRRWRVMQNQGTASLCQTGMEAHALPFLKDACVQRPEAIDWWLWQYGLRRSHLLAIDRCVGIKGLPGRPGIGVGHKPERHPEQWTADPKLTVLREWIGNDVELYREFLGGAAAQFGR